MTLLRSQPPAVPSGTTRLIGRDTEVRQLRTVLAAAAAGRGGTLFLTGEPGVGKSRLASEALAAAAAAGMATARGGVSSLTPALPFRPVIEALHHLARKGLLPSRGSMGSWAAALDAVVPVWAASGPWSAPDGERVPARARRTADGPPARSTRVASAAFRGPAVSGAQPEDRPVGSDGEGSASAMVVAEGLLRLFGVIGRQGCLVVLEDLQDADVQTLAVVEYLMDNIADQPVLLLLTCGRSDCVAGDLAARAAQRGTATILDLPPLSPSAVRALVAVRLGINAAAVGSAVLDRVVASSRGNPLLVEELARGLAGPAAINGRTTSLPDSVTRSVMARTDRAGPAGRAALLTAALFGARFPGSVVRHATGCEDRESAALFRSGTASYLWEPDRETDWFAFRHPAVAQAVRDSLTPGERIRYARRALTSLHALHPGLPGDWCERAADLSVHADDPLHAARLYQEAGRRAIAAGAVDRAVDLLLRAVSLLEDGDANALRAAALEQLLRAAACAGRFELLPPLSRVVDALDDGTVTSAERAVLAADVAALTAAAGRPVDALHRLDVARGLLRGVGDDRHHALVELAAAQVETYRPATDGWRTAAACAHRAAAASARAELPDVHCRALVLLGRLAAVEDEPAAVSHLTRACVLARRHGLPVEGVLAELALACLTARRDGGWERVETVRRQASRMGARVAASYADAALAVDESRRGEFTAAALRLRPGAAEVAHARLGAALPTLLLADAVRHAHRGDLDALAEILDRLETVAGHMPGVRALAHGHARALCYLLTEDRASAEQEWIRASALDAAVPAGRGSGRFGPRVLLDVLAGRLGRARLRANAVTSAGDRWNRVFTGLAHAVLLGREGRPGEADAATRAACAAAEPYPLARHLGLRLVAEAAHEDGWGDPVGWLQEAEEFFHSAALPEAAKACRGLLRGMGEPLRQRRVGVEVVPAHLRRLGITVREFDVARLLVRRASNRGIAEELHISPRTAEKHVASLLRKTGHPDRASFAAHLTPIDG
ncbi:regulatory protein, luxR family [Actinacidiphila alni]|uniref:Regulatory protein, luxR family n=1 Tax=Actinacidiphila alni TaxID=380248 RepID=A0A1I2LJ01_9ACTN|nr:regulatory protein, luxR family [Actinacidiphila alni]